jgi:hypothetical protein
MSMRHDTSAPEIPERQPLADITKQILEECRMVLPGIQALFGFQLVAVFNKPFWDMLTDVDRYLHLAAMLGVAVSVALVMAPAAYHRQCHLDTLTRRFIMVSSRLLLLAMIPLLAGICIDSYLIASMILKHRAAAVAVAVALGVVFVFLWFILPRLAPTAVLSPTGGIRGPQPTR